MAATVGLFKQFTRHVSHRHDPSPYSSSPHYSRRLLLQPPKRNQNLLRYSFFAPGSYKGRSTSQARWRRTWTRAGSPLSRSAYCFKYASLPRGLGPEACLAHSYKGAGPLVESPRREHTPFGTPRRGVTPPRGSARLSRPPTHPSPIVWGRDGWGTTNRHE